jgi:hypothetical protein
MALSLRCLPREGRTRAQGASSSAESRKRWATIATASTPARASLTMKKVAPQTAAQ